MIQRYITVFQDFLEASQFPSSVGTTPVGTMPALGMVRTRGNKNFRKRNLRRKKRQHDMY